MWAAVGEELDGVGGLYLEDCAQAPVRAVSPPGPGVEPYAIDAEAAERLWTLSAQTTAS